MPGTTNGSANGTRGFPENVGIINLDFYFPSEYVDQSELEVHDGVSQGKYLIGLGQTRMAICSDREDIHSICLTVTKRLFEKTGISSKDVGCLYVGTETLLDKSKSVKSVLMQLFEDSGNYDVQGIDLTNACFGGTASLFAAVDWVESSSWDGRYAIVVCGDIAVYAEGAARPTGGAGAIAMLIGPNAPLVIDRGVRTHQVMNTYDFYKPDLSSEYPVVDGKLSISCYMEAVYNAYHHFRRKFAGLHGLPESGVSVESFDGLIFHAPYCKIVSKALARIAFNDFKNDPNPDFEGRYKGLEQYR
jgi:hydroxymethylglutaryl-CoA synthase